jgi:hypothetical protein
MSPARYDTVFVLGIAKRRRWNPLAPIPRKERSDKWFIEVVLFR